MKKLLIILAIIAVVIGGILVFVYSSDTKEEIDGSDQNTIKVEDSTYYEADYADGDTSTSVKDLTFSPPSMFTGIESDDDSVNQNLYIDKSTGVKLSISEQHSRSHKEYEKEINDYLESASNIEKFKVGNYTAFKFNYMEGKSVVECDFLILTEDTFYSGYMYHEGKVDDIQEDEAEAIPLNKDMISELNKLCDSLAFK